MEVVMHILGVCGDTHAHFDLIDMLLLGGVSTPTLVYIKYKVKFLFKNDGRKK